MAGASIETASGSAEKPNPLKQRALWTPHPGPQSNAIAADWCPCIFYGGGKFSGKTDFLLGDYLQDLDRYREHWQGIVFRRALTEFTEMKLRASELFPKVGGVWQEQKSQWIFPNHATKDGSMMATLRFKYLENLKDIRLYEGHCVAIGTLIKMGDGSLKPVEQIQVGEQVLTLCGPKRVLATHGKQSKLCVSLKGLRRGHDNQPLEQVHPVDHKILTSSGWVSYASILAIDSKEFEQRGQAFCTLPSVDILARCHESSLRLNERKSQIGIQFYNDGKCCELFEAERPSLRQSLARKLLGLLPSLSPLRQIQRCGLVQWVVDVINHALIGSLKAQDSQFCYPCGCHLSDEQPLGLLRSGLSGTPLQDGAVRPSRALCRQDVGDDTQACNQYCSCKYEFFHPYSDRVLLASEESVYVPCIMNPIGYVDVCDLTVEDVNHYISSSNFVNKNSYPWIAVDELGDWEDPKAFFRLFTFNRYGRHPIPNKRIRATGNPGGRGHLWIKKYFVDPAPMGSKILFDEELQTTYMFILGTYRDNTIGMQNDPNYANKMNRAGSPALIKALKDGDFSVVAGAFFEEFDRSHIIYPFEIPKHWTRFMSMDWGACGEGDPFSIGWWAVADGDDQRGTIPYFKRGTKIRYREWWGKGLKRVTVAEVAKGIKERESGGEEIGWRCAGGDIKKKNDQSGPSVFEMFADHGLHFQRADMGRVAGWLQMRQEFKPLDGTPTVRVFSTCHDSIEVIAATQHSIKDANDIEEVNDDIPDEWRYGLMSRPYVTDADVPSSTIEQKFASKPSIDQLWAMRESSLRSGRR